MTVRVYHHWPACVPAAPPLRKERIQRSESMPAHWHHGDLAGATRLRNEMSKPHAYM